MMFNFFCPTVLRDILSPQRPEEHLELRLLLPQVQGPDRERVVRQRRRLRELQVRLHPAEEPA